MGTDEACDATSDIELDEFGDVRGGGVGPVPAAGPIPPPDSVPRAGKGAESTTDAQLLRRTKLYMSSIIRNRRAFPRAGEAIRKRRGKAKVFALRW